MKCRGHRAQQHAGRLDIQLHRQLPSSGIRVHRRPRRRQRSRGRRHLPPGLRLANDPFGARMLGQQRRPPGKRRPHCRQGYRLPTVMLRPSNIEVLQQNPPRHPINGQMVNDQRQLASVANPQRAQHHAAGRIQLRPRLHQRRIRQHVRHVQAPGRVHRTRLRHP